MSPVTIFWRLRAVFATVPAATMIALALALAAQQDFASLTAKFEEERALPTVQRYATISAIGQLKTDEAAQFLIEALPRETDAGAQSYVLSALGQTERPAALRAICAVAGDAAREYSLRHSAVSAIGQFRTTEARDYLLGILRDPDPQNLLRMSALYALRPWPLDEVRDALFGLLDDTNPSVKAEVLHRLAPLGDERVLRAARAALADPTAMSQLQEAAVEALTVPGNAAAAEALLSVAQPTGRLRELIVEALGALTNAEAQQFILTAARRALSDASRELAVRALAKLAHEDAVETLIAALRDRVEAVRGAAVEALGERGAGLDDVRHFVERGEGAVQLAAIGALGRFPKDEESVELLLRLLRARTPEVRLAAIVALGDLRATEALERFEDLLRSRDWRERAAVIQSLVKLRVKESLDLLIPQLDREEGRLKGDVVDALTRLTGRTLGLESWHWREWWAAQRETFEFPRETAAGAPVAAGGTGSYYGIPLLSKRLIFCLDYSGSMSAASGSTTRLEEAKEQLVQAITSLPADAAFNVIFFDDQVQAWEGELQRATAENKARAEARIRQLQPSGGTNIYDPLERAMLDAAVDTVFLLSDGAPGSGKWVDTEDILREVGNLNRSRQIVIHTISLGASPFMRQLAERNGGRYVER